MLVGRNLKDSTTKRFDLFTWHERRIGIDKKIELDFTSVNMAIIVHDNGLDAAANHLANNLGYPNRFSHLASTATGKDLNDCEENNL